MKFPKTQNLITLSLVGLIGSLLAATETEADMGAYIKEVLKQRHGEQIALSVSEIIYEANGKMGLISKRVRKKGLRII